MKRRAAERAKQTGIQNREGKRSQLIRVKTRDVCGGVIAARAHQDETLAYLAASIARQGLLQPVLVRRGMEEGRYVLICGARRLAACRLLGLEEIDAFLLDVTPAAGAACFLEEHMTRFAPHVLDDAQMIASIGEREISESFSLGKHELDRRALLLSLPETVRQVARSAMLSLEQTEPLLDIPDEHRQIEAVQIIAERSLTPVQARRLVSGPALRAVRRSEPQTGRRRAIRFALEEIAAVAERLRAQGMEVSVAVHSQDGGMCIQVLLQNGEKVSGRQEKENMSRI